MKIQINWPRVFSNSSSSSLHLAQHTANPSVGPNREGDSVQSVWQSSKCFLLGFFLFTCSCGLVYWPHPFALILQIQDTIPHRLQCRRDAQSERRIDCSPQLTAQWATKLKINTVCVSNHVLQTSGTLSTICSFSTSFLVDSLITTTNCFEAMRRGPLRSLCWLQHCLNQSVSTGDCWVSPSTMKQLQNWHQSLSASNITIGKKFAQVVADVYTMTGQQLAYFEEQTNLTPEGNDEPTWKKSCFKLRRQQERQPFGFSRAGIGAWS